MKRIIIATKNSGKAKDFEKLFSKKGWGVTTLNDFPELPEVEETGTTFQENAMLKAETISKQLEKIVLADDSGLVIDALDGRPGVYSARYAGNDKNDQANIEKVLNELKDTPSHLRTAHFYCALAVAVPGEQTRIVSGICEGEIAEAPDGVNGFGYDPIFIPKDKHQTMAQLTAEEKNQISHRKRAMDELEKHWDDIFGVN